MRAKSNSKTDYFLHEDLGKEAKKIYMRKIKYIEKFSDISETLVKRYARELHYPRKSRNPYRPAIRLILPWDFFEYKILLYTVFRVI